MANTLTILIVEDDAFLLSMYTEKFRAEGFEVVTASNGTEAIKVATESEPDIILLDVMLPQADGFTVLEQLKNSKQTNDIPVLLLTNLSQKEDIARGQQLGAVDFLIKAHFMPNEVVRRVQSVLTNTK